MPRPYRLASERAFIQDQTLRPRLLQDMRESVTVHSDEDVDMGRRPFGAPPEPQAGRAEANLWTHSALRSWRRTRGRHDPWPDILGAFRLAVLRPRREAAADCRAARTNEPLALPPGVRGQSPEGRRWRYLAAYYSTQWVPNA